MVWGDEVERLMGQELLPTDEWLSSFNWYTRDWQCAQGRKESIRYFLDR